MGVPAMELINKLVATAAAVGAVEIRTFMAGALKSLSIVLCRGDDVLCITFAAIVAWLVRAVALSWQE